MDITPAGIAFATILTLTFAFLFCGRPSEVIEGLGALFTIALVLSLAAGVMVFAAMVVRAVLIINGITS